MTASMLTLPAFYAVTASLGAAWHPCRPASVSVASGVATITCDGLTAMYWRLRAPKLGGAYIGAQPDHDYLTNNAAEIFTDSTGAPLWTEPPVRDYITTNAGAVITDTAGANLWI